VITERNNRFGNSLAGLRSLGTTHALLRRVPEQMWAGYGFSLRSPGADVGRSRRRCGPVPAQMWAGRGADVGQSVVAQMWGSRSRRRCGQSDVSPLVAASLREPRRRFRGKSSAAVRLGSL
jgi:hypothetical protein